MPRKNDEVSSLSHTKWDCKYHIVFTPKYRRKAIYAKLRADIGKYIRRCCMYKGVEIIEAHAMPDHIHMLVRIPPKQAVSSFMGYLKGKTSLMIFDEHANLKYNYGHQALLVRGLLRQHGRPEQGHGAEVHPRPGARGPGRGSSEPEGVQGPVHG